MELGQMQARWLAVVGLAVAIVVAAGIFSAQPVHAAQPDIVRLDTELHITLPSAICGFPIDLDGEGTRTIKTHYDQSGEVVRTVVKQQSFGTLSNPENGNSLDFVVAWTQTTYPNVDGDPIVVTNGHIGSLQLAGAGSLTASVGRLVTEGDTTVFEAGRHEPQFTAEVCAALT